MSIERIFHCDWRECERHVRGRELALRTGLIFLTEHPGPTLHFCSWDCVLKHAAEKPPVEVIPMEEAA